MTNEKPIDCRSCALFPSCAHPLKRNLRLCHDFTGPCDACGGPMYALSRRWAPDGRLKEAEYACENPDCGATYRIRIVSPQDENWGP